MEKTRKIAKGRISEFFGADGVVIDQFMRYIGLERTSKETWNEGIDPEVALNMQAFSDGVNDYVQGISLSPFDKNKTARVMPPEFLLLGVTKDSFEPWTPIDCLLTVRLMTFGLTWNWA